MLFEQVSKPDGEDQISVRDGKRYVARLAPRRVHSSAEMSFRGDVTYLITGGLGGLGLHVARWLVERGARHLVLVARRAASSSAREAISEMEGGGARVAVMQADVSQYAELELLLRNVTDTLPPLRGIIHAAGVLDDGLLSRQDWDRFSTVLGPKAFGAWHLHRLTEGLPLDHFVMFSSAVSVLGAPGQGNYAAANAFLDSLAHHRRVLGLPAVTINWGPWASTGMTAAGSQRNRPGVDLIPPQQGMQIFEQILLDGAAQSVVLPVRWDRYFESLGDAQRPPLLEDLLNAAPAPPSRSSILEAIANAAEADRWRLLRNHVQQQVRRVLRLANSSELDCARGFAQMGMDSLMAVELRNSLQATLGKSLPATIAFDYPSVEKLAGYLGKTVLSFDTPAEESLAALLEAMQNVSGGELDRLLREGG